MLAGAVRCHQASPRCEGPGAMLIHATMGTLRRSKWDQFLHLNGNAVFAKQGACLELIFKMKEGTYDSAEGFCC